MNVLTSALRAGAAEIDITPALGTHMGGDAVRLRPVEKVLDPLYARALVVESGKGSDVQRVCLLCLDLCTPGDEISTEIRCKVAAQHGFDTGAVMFHLLQNHSAPSLGTHHLLTADSPYASPDYWWTYQSDPAYAAALIPKILQVVGEAVTNLEPVSMGVGGMCDGRVGFNRRAVMRDGWVQTQPTDLTQILHTEGPADPEVGVVCFRNAKGETIAALLHHTGHPVSHFQHNWVTASWPGAWAQQFRAIADERCVPLVVNGACGNINVRNTLDPKHKTSDALVGGWLTETSERVMAQMTWSTEGVVACAHRKLELPFEPVENTVGTETLEHARKLIDAEPQPRWANDEHTALDIEWLFAVYTLDIERRTRDSVYPYEVQAFRIGGMGLVGLTGEPFVEGQLRLKLESPFERTFVAHMCNGWIGYIPPEHAHKAKNYNFRTPDGVPVRRGANLFLLPPYALDRIVDTGVELLRGLFDG